MKISWVRLTFVIVCFVAALHYAASDCCGRDRVRNGESELVCNDCTNGTPCCGNGRCNIFCCGCDDGCRVRDEGSTGNCPARQRRGIPLLPMQYHQHHHHQFPIFHHNESDVHSILKFADYDNDGQLNFGEADYYLRHLTKANHYTGYKDLYVLDKNNNGFLSIDEIDPKREHVVNIDVAEPNVQPGVLPMVEVDHRVPESPVEGTPIGGGGQGGDIGIGEAGQGGFIGDGGLGQGGDASGGVGQGGSIGDGGLGQGGDTSEGVGQGVFIGDGGQGQGGDASGGVGQGGSIGDGGQDGDATRGGQGGFIGDGSQGQDVDATGSVGSMGGEGFSQGELLSGGQGQGGGVIGGGGEGNEGVVTGDAGPSQGGDESHGQAQLEDDGDIGIDTRLGGGTGKKVETGRN